MVMSPPQHGTLCVSLPSYLHCLVPSCSYPCLTEWQPVREAGWMAGLQLPMCQGCSGAGEGLSPASSPLVAGGGLLPCSGVSEPHRGSKLMRWGTVLDRTRVVLQDQ